MTKSLINNYCKKRCTLTVLSLSVLILCASNTHAALDNETQLNNETQVDSEDNLPLISLDHLTSLKGMTTQKNQLAPHVHELRNFERVRTLFVQSSSLPIVDLQLTFNAGSARDEHIAPGLYGLSNMTANLITEGTAQYSSAQIANMLEQMGAKMSVQAYRDMFVVKLRVMSDPDKLNPAVDLLLHILTQANFDTSGLSMVWNNTQVGQKQVKENPNQLIDVQLYRSLYGEHPYAQPITGTVSSIRKINPEYLKQFRDHFLVSKNMNIALTGQLSLAQAKALSRRIIQALPKGQAADALPQPIETKGFKIQHIPYQSDQAYVAIAHLSTKRDDPDHLALEVANQMLGGAGFNSRLMQELRLKRGYTYGAYSQFTFPQSEGIFRIQYSTQQDHLLDSIAVAHQTLLDFIRYPLSQRQFEETKAGMLRAYPMTFASNASMNSQLGLIGFYGLPNDYLALYPKALQKLSLDDVEKAIKQHMHADGLTVVVASKALNSTQLLNILEQQLKPAPDAIPLQERATTPASATHPQAVAQDNDDLERSQTDRF